MAPRSRAQKEAGRFLLAFAVLLCVLIVLLVLRSKRNDPEEQVRQYLQTTHPTAPAVEILQQEPAATEPYVSPVDFASLWEKNEEVVAWLEIPDTSISYPILRSRTDNAYYLNHDAAGWYYAPGSLFVEDYNVAELTDPVTVVYGHRMRDGAFFGDLQSIYETAAGFEAHRTVHLYLPERQEEYRVVAAVPFAPAHILYSYDFTRRNAHYSFFDQVFSSRSMSANLVQEDYPEFGEKCLILSTCLTGDRSRRYLVIAKEIG